MELSRLIATIKATGIPVAYGSMKAGTKVPFIVCIGDGMDSFYADDTIYMSTDRFLIEYYFEDKNPKFEKKLEAALLEAGYIFTKSEDISLEDNDVHYITYNV